MIRPVIAITMGDPASIGPEITIKALGGHSELYEQCKPLVIGDAEIMRRARKMVGREDIEIHPVSSVSEALFTPGTIDVYDMKMVNADTMKIGQVSVEAGNAAFQYVKKVIEMAMADEVDGTVTNALNKEAMSLAASKLPVRCKFIIRHGIA